MREMPFHEFRSHLKEAVEQVVEAHVPLRVRRRDGQDFVVVSAEDWEQEQETLYVLQNRSLMEQIELSMKAHPRPRRAVRGRTPEHPPLPSDPERPRRDPASPGRDRQL